MRPPTEVDLYEVLGVSEKAPPEVIKAAVKVLQRKWHPDTNSDPAAEATMKLINLASEVLTNPAKRREYDSDRAGSSPATGSRGPSSSARSGPTGPAIPVPEPAVVDFGALRVGDRRVQSILVRSSDGSPSRISVTPDAHVHGWVITDAYQPDDEPGVVLRIDLTMTAPDSSAGGRTSMLTVTFDGSDVVVPIRYELLVPPPPSTSWPPSSTPKPTSPRTATSLAAASTPVLRGTRRRTAFIAIAGIAVVSIVIAPVSAQNSAETSKASQSVQSDVTDTVPPVSEPPTPASHSVTGATSDLHSGAESRYSADYGARVDSVTQDGLQLHIDFTASGLSDLRRPETSCMVISGADGQTYVSRPTGVALASDEVGRFVGRLSFPAIVSGEYRLQYSCADDYSTADIGSVTVPAVGVSRYSEDYYAVVLGFDGTRVQFAVHGRSNLLAPNSSCVILDGQSLTSTVALDSEWAIDAITLIGTMEFPAEVAGRVFVYSCNSYSEVPLR